MVIAERASAGDKEIVTGNVNFFVDKEAEKMLEGVTMHFEPNGFRRQALSGSGAVADN